MGAYYYLNNLTSVTDWAGRVTAYTYDVNNKVTSVTKPDGSITATVYDNKQRIVSCITRNKNGTVIAGFRYIYDSLGRIISEENLVNDTEMCYTYDKLSRF